MLSRGAVFSLTACGVLSECAVSAVILPDCLPLLAGLDAAMKETALGQQKLTGSCHFPGGQTGSCPLGIRKLSIRGFQMVEKKLNTLRKLRMKPPTCPLHLKVWI